MDYYVELNNEHIVEGYYNEDINGYEKCDHVLALGGIKIDQELWEHLTSLNQCRFLGVLEDRLYTIVDKDLFEKVVTQVDPGVPVPSLEDRIKILEDMQINAL